MHPVGLGAWLLAGALAHQARVHDVVTVTASRLPAEAAAPRCTVGAQVRGDRMYGLGWEVPPGLGLELDLGRGATLSAHRRRSFRQPSFTDLYYDSPATVGNPALRPEHAWSDELLRRLPLNRTLVELSVFRRDARQLIDFLRGDDGVYRAANRARVVTRGAEWSLQLPDTSLLGASRVWASWLHSEVDVDPSRSRDALAHPRWEAGARPAGPYRSG